MDIQTINLKKIINQKKKIRELAAFFRINNSFNKTWCNYKVHLKSKIIF